MHVVCPLRWHRTTQAVFQNRCLILAALCTFLMRAARTIRQGCDAPLLCVCIHTLPIMRQSATTPSYVYDMYPWFGRQPCLERSLWTAPKGAVYRLSSGRFVSISFTTAQKRQCGSIWFTIWCAAVSCILLSLWITIFMEPLMPHAHADTMVSQANATTEFRCVHRN